MVMVSSEAMFQREREGKEGGGRRVGLVGIYKEAGRSETYGCELKEEVNHWRDSGIFFIFLPWIDHSIIARRVAQ